MAKDRFRANKQRDVGFRDGGREIVPNTVVYQHQNQVHISRLRAALATEYLDLRSRQAFGEWLVWLLEKDTHGLTPGRLKWLSNVEITVRRCASGEISPPAPGPGQDPNRKNTPRPKSERFQSFFATKPEKPPV